MTPGVEYMSFCVNIEKISTCVAFICIFIKQPRKATLETNNSSYLSSWGAREREEGRWGINSCHNLMNARSAPASMPVIRTAHNLSCRSLITLRLTRYSIS